MIWENCDASFEEEFADETQQEARQDIQEEMKRNMEEIIAKNEQSMMIKLFSIRDPSKNTARQACISIMLHFGELLVQDKKKEIIETCLTEDCEQFLFNFVEIAPLQYSDTRNGFLSLYQGFDVVMREVKATHVDATNKTGFQICRCELFNKEHDITVSQFSFEAFSFQNNKISKYRAIFGSYGPCEDYVDLFEPSKLELKLAKVRELNYAWADKPDLEKIASQFTTSTEYKIWSWDEQEYFAFYKKDFVEGFRSLEKNFTLKHIVPYDVYHHEDYIIGTYVYSLEGRGEHSGEKFLWLSTCIYTFDDDLNFAKISQQGDLHHAGTMLIPFLSYSKEKAVERIKAYCEDLKSVSSYWDIYCHQEFDFSCQVNRFTSLSLPCGGRFKGYAEVETATQNVQQSNYEWIKAVDIFLDPHDPSYNSAIIIDCTQGVINMEDFKYSGQLLNLLTIKRLSVENGKVVKMVTFVTEIPEAIPSPFDDQSFSSDLIIPKSMIDNYPV